MIRPFTKPERLAIRAILLLSAWLAIASVSSLYAQTTGALDPSPLSRTNLLLFHNHRGQVLPVRSVADWQKRRAEIIKGMQQIMGPLPDNEKKCPLDITVREEIDCGSFIKRRVTYSSEPGSRVPAFLLLPKPISAHRKHPAILALHPTDMQFGNRVVVESLRDHYRAYAKDLAERRYVVLAPAYPLMADYQPDLKALGYQSGTMKAVWDNLRGLDVLESLPFVDGKKIGAIGHSLGGHNAIFTAVFDSRIKVVVSSCGFDSFADYMDGQIKGWTSDRYMPRLLAYRDQVDSVPFDFYGLIGALAPRPVFINAPLGDSNFKWRSVDAIVRAAAPIFDLYRKPQNLVVEHPDCDHDFPAEIREEAYRFLDRRLK
jgi:dienelactone hydrolase